MIKSMTGFGRFETLKDQRKFTVEIKSVNHRYLDVNIKMPKSFAFFESAIRTELKKYISRGKVDVFITCEEFGESNTGVKYHREVAADYLKYLEQMAEEFGLEKNIGVKELASFPEVFTMEGQSVDEEELWKELSEAIDGAAENFVNTRIVEGEHLREDLIAKLDGMLLLVARIEEKAPQILQDYRERLTQRVEELLQDTQMDEGRILTEVAVFADRICVDEELVRLRSHIETTRNTLVEGGSVGRKLDFIAQEMNREANTILSKSNDLEVSNCAITLKTEIEKVREQIQNVE